MFLVWVINPESGEEVPLNLLFEGLNDAFEYKEFLSKKYPSLIFFHTAGIDVEISQMKNLKDILDV